MSLEQNIERIAAALEAIARDMNRKNEEAPTPAAPVQPQVPVPVQTPVPSTDNGQMPQQAMGAPVQQPVPAADQQNRWPDYSKNPAPINTTPVLPPQSVQPVATSQVSYTMDDLAKAGIALMDSGRQAELQQVLIRFGVESLPSLPTTQYGAFATALREMGAPI